MVLTYPDHPPPAMHEVAFAVVQVNVVDAPDATAPGLALSDTVGTGVPLAGFTVTTSDCWVVPPTPAQAMPNDVVAERGPTDWEPETPILPVQPPPGAHAVALVEDHVSVADAPAVIGLGAAVNVICGAGTTVTV